jgi:phosphatidylinositol phospholipase C delta
MSSSPKPDHKRHLSGSTLSSRAAAAVEKAEEKYEIAKQKLAEKRGLGLTKENSHEKLPTNDSLAIGNSIERPPSIRSMRNGEPLVLHGWTLTTPVGFRAVCKSIRETAFATSKLPIIVSLEVHADLEQQEIMVDIMKEEWKGLLVEGPHEACNPEERLPRLDEMLEKILIKVKKASVAPTASSNSLAPVSSHRDGDSASGSEDERGNTKPKKIKICEALSNLAVYTHSEHFVSFEAKSAKKPSHIFSIGENQIMELHQTRQQDMFNHNRDFFMRAYPAAFRINSSNLDPSVFWRKGVQMVAMNWQNLDHGMMLNEGMFAGEHGWVLKPPGYRTDATEPINHKTLYLKVTVYSGQHIPIPPHQTERGFHPYIRCELHVEKPEEKSGEPVPGGGRVKGGELKQKTEYKKGDHPDFGDHGVVLEFKEIKVVEELSFIR